MIDLHLDLREPQTHRLQVRLHVRPRHSVLRFALPAWTPGSYLIRDYVRHLEGLEVIQAGERLRPQRQGVAAWQLELADLAPIIIRYAVMATELTVRTCHLTDQHGFLALAAVAMAIDGDRWTPHRLTLELPDRWHAFVPLPAVGHLCWQAESFDRLVDTPVEVGPHSSHGFAVAGVSHRWVSWGRCSDGRDLVLSDPQWLHDVEKVCLTCCRLMGVDHPPCGDQGYLFVLHLLDSGYGGLEHDLSAVLQFSRRRLLKPDGRRHLLQLVAHEYLHQWNVRRLRPRELTPYRYDTAVVVPSLWFAEGVTSYLDQLIPHAAGLTGEQDLLEDLGADLSRYRLSPGRHVQSLRESSEEAWVKLYKPDAHSPGSQISYYLKGAVLALVLDLWLRREGASLIQVLRLLWQRFGRPARGYGEADLLEAFAAFSPDLAPLLPQWLEGREDPPLDALLADLGLRLEPKPGTSAWLGWTLELQAGELRVQRVWREGPAERAGVMVGDEVLAIDGQRLRHPEDPVVQPQAQQGNCAPLTLLTCRDGLLLERSLLPEAPRPTGWSLVVDPGADPRCLERRRAWRLLQVEA